MSYDVSVLDRCECCNRTEVFWSGGCTYNLSKVLYALGLRFNDLPRPMGTADMVDVLRAALAELEADLEKYRAMNPSNGWGDVDTMISSFLKPMLRACERNCAATVEVD